MKGKEKNLGEMVDKVFSLGLGAAFVTEEYLRGMLGEMSLPKDIAAGIIQQANKTKGDLLGLLREELKKHLAKVDIVKPLEHILKEHDLEIKATVRFKKKKK